jgi:hypothetical protein
METLRTPVLQTGSYARVGWRPSVSSALVAYVRTPGPRRTVARRVDGRVRRVEEQSIGTIRVYDVVTGRDDVIAHGPYVPRSRLRHAGHTWLDFAYPTIAVAWRTRPADRSRHEIRAYATDGSSRRVAVGWDGAPSAPGEPACAGAVLSPTVTPSGIVYGVQGANGWWTARWNNGHTMYGPHRIATSGAGAPRLFSAVYDRPRLVVAEEREPGTNTYAVNEYPLGPFERARPAVRGCDPP